MGSRTHLHFEYICIYMYVITHKWIYSFKGQTNVCVPMDAGVKIVNKGNLWNVMFKL